MMRLDFHFSLLFSDSPVENTRFHLARFRLDPCSQRVERALGVHETGGCHPLAHDADVVRINLDADKIFVKTLNRLFSGSSQTCFFLRSSACAKCFLALFPLAARLDIVAQTFRPGRDLVFIGVAAVLELHSQWRAF